MNNWTDPTHAYAKQYVQRLEGLTAFLYGDENCENPKSVTVILVNKILDKVILPEGYHRHDFNDLRADIELALTEWFGYGKNEIDLGLLR